MEEVDVKTFKDLTIDELLREREYFIKQRNYYSSIIKECEAEISRRYA